MNLFMLCWMIAGFPLGMWSISLASKAVGYGKCHNLDSIIAGLIGVLVVYTIFRS